MAFTVTERGSAGSGYGTSSTIASHTLAADSLCILTIHRGNTTDVSTIVGHGTWVELNDGSNAADISAGGRRMWKYGLLIGGSSSTDTLQVTWANNSNIEIDVIEILGADVSGTVNDAIVQLNAGSIYNASGGPFTNTFSLSAFASATNLTMISGSDTSAAEGGYTTAFSGTRFDTFYLASEDTTPSYQSTNTFSTTKGISVEIAEGSAVTSVLTGTMTATVDEDDITAGGKTIIVTLSGDTFKAAGTGPIGSTADTQALIDGFDAASSPTNGWNNEVRDKAATTEVVRTSSTVATWTVAAQAGYDVSAQETITGTIPTAVLVTGAGAITSTPTFTVDPVSSGTSKFLLLLGAG